MMPSMSCFTVCVACSVSVHRISTGQGFRTRGDSFMFNDQFSLKKEFCSQLVMAGEQGAHKCPVELLAGHAAGKWTHAYSALFKPT